MNNHVKEFYQDVKKKPALDGCRGLAILLVMGYHFFGTYHPFDAGWAGVDLFFVLSGYLITSILESHNLTRANLWSFYRNRALRILPLYYLVTGAFLVWSFITDNSSQGYHYYRENALSYLLLTTNWTLIYNNLPSLPHLNHLWSIAVEAQFYLIWPPLLLILKKLKIRPYLLVFIAILCVMAFRYFNYLNQHAPTPYLNYFNTFSRLDAFLFGSLVYYDEQVAVLKRSNWNLITIFSILILLSFWLSNGSFKKETFFMETIGYSLIAALSAGLVYNCINSPNSYFNRLMQNKWLIIFGKYSFGMYILHWLLLQSIQTRFYNKLSDFPNLPIPKSILLGIIFFISSFVMSIISYHFFEHYFLSKKRPLY